MAIVTPKYRVLLDDTDSVQDPLAYAVFQLVQPEDAVTWDLIPFGETIRQLDYEVASRTVTGRQVVLDADILVADTQVTMTAGTYARVTAGHVLYHPATKQRVVLDTHPTTGGVSNIRNVLQADGGARTQINNGETLYVLAQTELYENISAESRFETTVTERNYVQDVTEKLEWSVADLREARKWGVDRRRRLSERLRDVAKDLSLTLLYGVPSATNGTISATTSGFDYLVEKGGNVVTAATPGTAAESDLNGILKQLQKNGVGPSDGLIMHGNVDVYHAYKDLGLATVTLQGTQGGTETLGGLVDGINAPGIGFVPFIVDPHVPDTRLRFIATQHAQKAYYQGQGEGAINEALRIIDEPSMSNSKNTVSTMQLKFGTKITNVDRTHYILETGL